MACGRRQKRNSSSGNSCSVATPEHSEPLPPKNHVLVVALMPDLWRVSFYSVINENISPSIKLKGRINGNGLYIL